MKNITKFVYYFSLPQNLFCPLNPEIDILINILEPKKLSWEEKVGMYHVLPPLIYLFCLKLYFKID